MKISLSQMSEVPLRALQTFVTKFFVYRDYKKKCQGVTLKRRSGSG